MTAAHSIEKMSNKDFKTVANSENLVTIRRSRFTGGRRRRVFLSTKRIRTCVSRSAIRGWSPTPEVAHISFYCTIAIMQLPQVAIVFPKLSFIQFESSQAKLVCIIKQSLYDIFVSNHMVPCNASYWSLTEIICR